VPEFSLIEKLQQSRLDIALNPRELPTLEVSREVQLSDYNRYDPIQRLNMHYDAIEAKIPEFQERSLRLHPAFDLLRLCIPKKLLGL
jgi:hypothetical protein